MAEGTVTWKGFQNAFKVYLATLEQQKLSDKEKKILLLSCITRKAANLVYGFEPEGEIFEKYPTYSAL